MQFRFFSCIALASAIFVIVMLLLNLLFFQQYYLLQKKAKLTDTYKQIYLQYNTDIDIPIDTLQELENRGLLQAQRTAGRIVTAAADDLTALRHKRARLLVQDCLGQLRALGMNEEEIETLLKEVQHGNDV